MDNITNPDFRKHIKHNWYIDPSFPECGFLTRDEANILFNAALQFSGKPALEIGSHTGWSTVHIALSGVKLDVIEPQLTFDPRILLGIIGTLFHVKFNQLENLTASIMNRIAKAGRRVKERQSRARIQS
jgi:hypothetical protein